jgi:hypothetical protein
VKTQLHALGVFVLALALQVALRAQEPAPPAAQKPSADKPAAATAKPAGSPLPIRLQFVIAKYQGEKKTSSLPYSLSLSTNGVPVRLRMGADVPYIANPVSPDGKSTASYNYRSVGVSIDGTVSVVEMGLYRVDVTVVDDSLHTQTQGPPALSAVPAFRNFRTTNSIVLKDGQTTQLTTAADPTSGEVLRVDVTLTVVK